MDDPTERDTILGPQNLPVEICGQHKILRSRVFFTHGRKDQEKGNASLRCHRIKIQVAIEPWDRFSPLFNIEA